MVFSLATIASIVYSQIVASSRVPKIQNTQTSRGVHLNVHVPEELVVRLDVLCAKTRFPRRAIVTEALEEYLTRKEKRLAKEEAAA